MKSNRATVVTTIIKIDVERSPIHSRDFNSLINSFLYRFMIHLVPIWLFRNILAPGLQILFDIIRTDRNVTQSETIDVAHDFSIRINFNCMIVTMFLAIDSKAVPEDVIIKFLEILAVNKRTGDRGRLRLGKRMAIDKGIFEESAPFSRGSGSVETLLKEFRDFGVAKLTARLFLHAQHRL